MIVGEPLFVKGSLSSYLQRESEGLRPFVERIMRDNEGLEEEALVDLIVTNGSVAPLSIDFASPAKEVKPIKLTLEDYGRRVQIEGVRATKTYPYTGEQILFQLRPNRFTSVIPYGIVSRGTVTIGVEARNDADAIKSQIEQQEKMITEYAEWQKGDIENHNAGLRAKAVAEVRARRKHLEGLDRLKDLI